MKQKKTKTIFINKNTESLQLSSILYSPIFSVNNHKINPEFEKIVKYEVQRTKFERIHYSGVELNVHDDFPLFAIIISKYNQTKNHDIEIHENEIFDVLKLSMKSRDKAKRNVLIRRIERLENFKLQMKYYPNGDSENINDFSTRKAFTLFTKTEYDIKKKTFSVSLNKAFTDVSILNFEEELIDLDQFYEIKSHYAKALYLLMQTKKHKGQEIIYIDLKTLVDRFGNSNMVEKEKKSKVKFALNILKEMGHICDFEFVKIDRISKVMILNAYSKTKKKKEVDLKVV